MHNWLDTKVPVFRKLINGIQGTIEPGGTVVLLSAEIERSFYKVIHSSGVGYVWIGALEEVR